MKPSAENWYASGTFWTIVSVIVAVVGVAVTVWVTLRAAYPKRRLSYAMPVITPLLNAGQDVRHGLEVHRGGQILTDPHVLEVELVSQSRRDISNDNFNAGAPLRLDVGAPIIEILKTTSLPSDRGTPAVDIDGTTLRIGPGLIGKRQTISLSLLVDGPRPTLTCPQPPLIDVEVRKQQELPARELRAWAAAVTSVVVATAAAVAVAVP